MDTHPIRVLSLFSGVSGLGLGVRIAVPNSEHVGYVEIELPACEVLAARMADGSLDPAPIFTDIARFDGRPWRGAVDLIEGGFPCTDLSVAGKQAGIHGDKSGLWFEYLRIIREVQPGRVFIENVPPVLAFPAGGTVLGGLAGLGYDAVWLTLRASDVGASHGRKRAFILAYKPGHGWVEGWPKPERLIGGLNAPECDGALADASRNERPGGGRETGPRRGIREASNELDDATSPRLSGRRPEPSSEIWDGARGSEPGGRCDGMVHAGGPERWPLGERGSGGGEGFDGHRETSGGAGVTEPVLEERVGWWECEEHGRFPAYEFRGDEHYLRSDGDWMLKPGQCPECGSDGGSITYDPEHGGSLLVSAREIEGVDQVNSERARRETPGVGRHVDTGPEPETRGRELGHADEPGLQGRGERGHGTDQRAAGAAGDSGMASLPLFAPGPGAADLWASMLVRNPELRPAISQAEAEQLVHGLDDGLALTLAGSRADQLRACGNGVVALQAAVAFTVLSRRVTLT